MKAKGVRILYNRIRRNEDVNTISNLEKVAIAEIVKRCEICYAKWFKLTLQSSEGWYQQYRFTRRQQKQLIRELSPYLEREDWFSEE